MAFSSAPGYDLPSSYRPSEVLGGTSVTAAYRPGDNLFWGPLGVSTSQLKELANENELNLPIPASDRCEDFNTACELAISNATGTPGTIVIVAHQGPGTFIRRATPTVLRNAICKPFVLRHGCSEIVPIHNVTWNIVALGQEGMAFDNGTVNAQYVGGRAYEAWVVGGELVLRPTNLLSPAPEECVIVNKTGRTMRGGLGKVVNSIDQVARKEAIRTKRDSNRHLIGLTHILPGASHSIRIPKKQFDVYFIQHEDAGQTFVDNTQIVDFERVNFNTEAALLLSIGQVGVFTREENAAVHSLVLDGAKAIFADVDMVNPNGSLQGSS